MLMVPARKAKAVTKLVMRRIFSPLNSMTKNLQYWLTRGFDSRPIFDSEPIGKTHPNELRSQIPLNGRQRGQSICWPEFGSNGERGLSGLRQPAPATGGV
jgi:hypothetical protein